MATEVLYMDPDEWDDNDCLGPAEVTGPGFYWRPNSSARWVGPYKTTRLAREAAKDVTTLGNRLGAAMDYVRKRLGK